MNLGEEKTPLERGKTNFSIGLILMDEKFSMWDLLQSILLHFPIKHMIIVPLVFPSLMGLS